MENIRRPEVRADSLSVQIIAPDGYVLEKVGTRRGANGEWLASYIARLAER